MEYLIGIIPIILLFLFGISFSDIGEPELHIGLFYIVFFGIICPLIETFISQFLIIYLVSKFTKSISMPILISTLQFSLMHTYSMWYMITTFFIGLIFAFGFSSYYRYKGFKVAFLSIAFVHCVKNLVVFLSLYLWD